jgi:hypothetical protein
MSWLTPRTAANSNEERKAQYEERARRTLWIGAGLLGLIGLAASDLSAQVITKAPGAVTAAVPTLVVMAGGALAFARSGFEWEAHLRSSDAADDRPSKGWPEVAEFMYLSALLLAALTAVVYVVAFWWGSI